MTTVTTATAPVVAEPIPTPYKELESTVQSTPPMAEQVPEEETGTDSATGEGVDATRSAATTEPMPKMDTAPAGGESVDTQDTAIADASESTDGDDDTGAQPSTDPEGLIDIRPSELDESTPTNGEVTDAPETKQEDEKPLFSEVIDHGEHPEDTEGSPSSQPQTETLQTQLYPQAQEQAPYSQAQTYPLSHMPNPSQTPASAQALTQASYAQSQQQQLPYPQQQAQPQLPSPQQQPQPQATMQYGQPNPQQAPYTQPYPPQQQASYTQVQVFTNSQPTGGGPTKSKVAAGLLAIFLGLFGVHKFYLGQTNAGVSILLLNFILLLLSFLLVWTIFIPLFIYFVYFIEGFVFLIEGIIYFVKSDEEFQRDCVRG